VILAVKRHDSPMNRAKRMEPIEGVALRSARANVAPMSDFARAPLAAILGPTNTGKTHLAVERMCAHSSGMIGFPLRLLAREVYDRVVKIKGANQVALITGEEKILPKDARWFLCTAESMPVDRDFAFVALDEAQLGIDPERGHVFTDRMLHVSGREETMILGS
jgi:ATP-dependent RNA helicase SUPV3L1/SUV3